MVLATATGLILFGCSRPSEHAATSEPANPPVETSQTTFICTDANAAELLQWSENHGTLTGTFTDSRISGSAPNETVSSDNAAMSGTLSGSSITLNVSVLLTTKPLSGTVTASTLTLNVPQSDGSLQPAACHAATLQQWNELVAQLGNQADAANQAARQQQEQASTDAANARAEQDGQDALAVIQKFSLTADLTRLANDVKQTNTDLAAEKKAAAIGPNAPGETDCYNLSDNVNYAAQGSVEYDATGTFSYDLQTLSSDITAGRTAISTLQKDIAALQAASLSVPIGVDTAISSAESGITAAIESANGNVDQINTAVDSAYAVANATATGDCASQAIGAAPAHLPHISQ